MASNAEIEEEFKRMLNKFKKNPPDGTAVTPQQENVLQPRRQRIKKQNAKQQKQAKRGETPPTERSAGQQEQAAGSSRPRNLGKQTLDCQVADTVLVKEPNKKKKNKTRTRSQSLPGRDAEESSSTHPLVPSHDHAMLRDAEALYALTVTRAAENTNTPAKKKVKKKKKPKNNNTEAGDNSEVVPETEKKLTVKQQVADEARQLRKSSSMDERREDDGKVARKSSAPAKLGAHLDASLLSYHTTGFFPSFLTQTRIEIATDNVAILMA